jgi:hypothetical protein
MNFEKFLLLWDRIESIYGNIPDTIKNVLLINGFDSFLALKGIRYESHREFFESLEQTVKEFIKDNTSHMDNGSFFITDVEKDKYYLAKSFRCDAHQFKLLPGHRNLILNLTKEIDKMNAKDFFQLQRKSYDDDDVDDRENKEEYEEEFISEEIIVNEAENEEEKTPNFNERLISIQKISPINNVRSERRKTSRKRIPERMYNDDFSVYCTNPRKRRLPGRKHYSSTDDGIKERFGDLIRQSMRCILSQQQGDAIKDVELHIEKESSHAWHVLCPICNIRIKLTVVFENNGRYVNYKRSNFERHLRFSHCKSNDLNS